MTQAHGRRMGIRPMSAERTARITAGTPGYRELSDMFRVTYDADSWGTVQDWRFCLALAVYRTTGDTLPRFEPSPLTPAGDPATFGPSLVRLACRARGTLGLIAYAWRHGIATRDDIEALYGTLGRYADILRASGREY